MGVTEVEEDDEHDSKESVLQRYFLQEWKLVKSLLDDIISNGRVSDISSVHKIRSIVISLYLFCLFELHNYQFNAMLVVKILVKFNFAFLNFFFVVV